MTIEIESAADKRQMAEVEATSIMERAVTHVKIYHPFYGALMHKLRLKLDWRHKSIYVDAVVVGFNPEWVVKANWDKLLYVLVHCVTHCAMRHPFRRGDRDPKLYGEATDHVVNLALAGDESLAASYPQEGEHEYCGPRDERFRMMAAEQVYSVLYTEQPPSQQDKSDDRKQKEKQKTEMKGLAQNAAGDCGDAGASGEPIPKEEEEEEKKEGDGKPAKRGDKEQSNEAPATEEAEQPEGAPEGEVEEGAGGEPVDEEDDPDGEHEGDNDGPAEEHGDESEQHPEVSIDDGEQGTPSPADVAQLEREWGEAVMTAVLAAGGEVGSSMQRALGEASKVRQSFDEYIDVFAAKCFNDAESWKRPNRRFSDVYLPSRSAPVVRKLLVGVDTSGSISDAVLRKFEIALQRVMDEFACGSIVAYCDTQIRKEEEFAVGDTVALEPEGGGGTRFSPIFERYLDLVQAGEDIAGVVYLTDLEGHVGGWQKYMDIETLWVSTETDPDKLFMELPHFGTVCNIHD